MQFNSGLNIKNFASQSGLECSFVFPADFNYTNNLSFGLSGDTTIFLKLNNGIFYDSLDRSIGSLNYLTESKLDINISNSISVIKYNDIPISYTYTSGLFDNIIVSGNEQHDIDILLKVEPLSINFSTVNNFSGVTGKVTGVVMNNNSDRYFKITGINILNSVESLTVESYHTGILTDSGVVLFSIPSGQLAPSGTIEFELLTNYKTINFSFDSNPYIEIEEEDYFSIAPSNFFLNYSDKKNILVESYFNFGNNRSGTVSLSHISSAYFTPKLTLFDFVATGILSGFVSGANNISGIMTGIFSGTETGISNYQTLYSFTGFYSGSVPVTLSGLSVSGISSGNVIYSTIYVDYSGVLDSGHSGRFTGTNIETITGTYYNFSGYTNQHYSIGPSGEHPYDGAFGYNITGTSTDFAYRSGITGFNFVIAISGLETGYDELFSNFQITDWIYTNSSGSTTGFYADSGSFYQVDSNHFSGFSGVNAIYTGIIPGSDSTEFNSLALENLSGTMTAFFGEIPWLYSPTNWNLSYFYINNFPVYTPNSVSLTGTGSYIHTITGNVSVETMGTLTTGIMYTSGQPNFTDVWNIKTGDSSLTLYDFKYYNKYSSGRYENSGSNVALNKNMLNSFLINLIYNGEGLSGINVAELSIGDGVNNLIYQITGYGE